MNALLRRLAATLLLLAALPGGVAVSAMQKVITQELPGEACYRGTREDVLAMVSRAAELVAETGPREAFRRFMRRGGGFIRGDLYVFVLDRHGTILANGASPASVGNNVLQAQDHNGHHFVQSILLQAFTRGHGWVDYLWLSPCTGNLTRKSTYFEVSGPFVIGVGHYPDPGI